eukprot:1949102-Amphidinium_carterae.1
MDCCSKSVEFGNLLLTAGSPPRKTYHHALVLRLCATGPHCFETVLQSCVCLVHRGENPHASYCQSESTPPPEVHTPRLSAKPNAKPNGISTHAQSKQVDPVQNALVISVNAQKTKMFHLFRATVMPSKCYSLMAYMAQSCTLRTLSNLIPNQRIGPLDSCIDKVHAHTHTKG